MKSYEYPDGYVKVREGILQGTIENGMHVFRGIPYAGAPVGDRRWKAPVPAPRWFGVRKADRLVGAALQADTHALMPSEELSAQYDSEDCLYLNIWTPAKKKSEKLPVFVWVHGGGMVAGTGMAPFFQGEKLAEKGIIVVTINYRLGLFGFLCTPELSSEAPQHTSGNYALLDMRQALIWLRENISAFGGDPDCITVGGHSGGAAGVSCLLMSPLMKGLCKSVIIQSGCPAIGGMMDASSLPVMEQSGKEFMEKIGCHSLEELRAMDGCDLIEASQKAGYVPNYTIDGWFLPDDTHALFSAGKFNDMNILVGSTSEEMGSFGFFHHPEIDPRRFEDYIRKTYPEELHEMLLKHYPHSTGPEAFLAVLRIIGDLMFLSPLLVGKVCAEKKQTCYVYLKTRPDPGIKGKECGSTHSSELPYEFGRPQKCLINPAGMDEEEIRFGAALMNYWVSFIKFADPNREQASVEWPLSEHELEYLDLGREIHQPSESEKEIFRAFQKMMADRGETNTRRYLDMTLIGKPDMFMPV